MPIQKIELSHSLLLRVLQFLPLTSTVTQRLLSDASSWLVSDLSLFLPALFIHGAIRIASLPAEMLRAFHYLSAPAIIDEAPLLDFSKKIFQFPTLRSRYLLAAGLT